MQKNVFDTQMFNNIKDMLIYRIRIKRSSNQIRLYEVCPLTIEWANAR